MCLGELTCALEIIRAQTCLYGILGDCNANGYGSRFKSEIFEFCEDNNFIYIMILRCSARPKRLLTSFICRNQRCTNLRSPSNSLKKLGMSL